MTEERNETWWNNLYKRHPYYITDNKIKMYHLLLTSKYKKMTFIDIPLKSSKDIKEFMKINFNMDLDQEIINDNLDLFVPLISQIIYLPVPDKFEELIILVLKMRDETYGTPGRYLINQIKGCRLFFDSLVSKDNIFNPIHLYDRRDEKHWIFYYRMYRIFGEENIDFKEMTTMNISNVTQNIKILHLNKLDINDLSYLINVKILTCLDFNTTRDCKLPVNLSYFGCSNIHRDVIIDYFPEKMEYIATNRRLITKKLPRGLKVLKCGSVITDDNTLPKSLVYLSLADMNNIYPEEITKLKNLQYYHGDYFPIESCFITNFHVTKKAKPPKNSYVSNINHDGCKVLISGKYDYEVNKGCQVLLSLFGDIMKDIPKHIKLVLSIELDFEYSVPENIDYYGYQS